MEPSSRTLSLPVAIVIAGLVIGLAIIWTNTKNNMPSTGNTVTVPPQGNTVAVDSSKITTTGDPFIGNPNAPLTIDYWFDYQCPFCQQDEENSIPQLVADYVNTGKVRLVFKDYAFLGTDSQTLGKYARAVWAVAPGQFYQWHKAIFDNQGTENTGWATQAKILAITTTVLGASDTAKVAQLVSANGATYQQQMDADKSQGTSYGISGTPAMVIGTQLVSGAVPYAQIKSAVDAALAGK